MFTLQTKVSEVLAKYPESLEVFLGVSSTFSKLKNPLMRKMLASRVSLEQASKIANIDPSQLITALNKACGLSETPIPPHVSDEKPTPTEVEVSIRPAILDHVASSQLVLLDVREEINKNADPFKKIMTAVKQLHGGQILHLINVFEPVPLYDVLAHRGLAHWTEEIDGVWHVYFYPSAKPAIINEFAPLSGVASTTNDSVSQLIELDVSGLEPPEPMMKILATLPTLPVGASLVVHHHREPMMLYPHLEERGYEWTTTQLAEDSYKIVIRMREEG